jgi:hypothetical protein
MCERQRGANTDVIASLPRELFSETNDNSVAILLAYGAAASSWLATPRLGRRSTWPPAPTRDFERSSTFRNYTHSELRFRAMLTGGATEMRLALS